jgi:hypothetical protein
MKILIAIKNALSRSVKSWKALMVIWFTTLLLVTLLAIPIKSVLNSGFGNSMITGKLVNGFNVEVFSDLGIILKSMISYFRSGFLLLILTGFLLNTFFTGGLFNCMKVSSNEFSVGEFFRSSAKKFWPFLVISMIISLIILIMIILTILLPVGFAGKADVPSEIAILKTSMIAISIFFLLLVILLLVADYARAWQVIQEKNRPFNAIGFGFRHTFRTFLLSYPLMIILLLVQLLYSWLIFKILPGMNPGTGGGVFLLFLLSQFLFFVRIFLKACRYGSVTALMELQKLIS